MRSRALLGAAVLSAGLASFASAAVVGQFDMSGKVTVSPTNMTWTAPDGVTADRFIVPVGTAFGIYVGTNGQTEQVDDLAIGVEPVGVSFPPQEFIKFLSPAGLSPLYISFIDAGFGGTGANPGQPCDPLGTPVVGQTCTPPNPGGSPFTFTNTPPPGDIKSTATWTFEGKSLDGQYSFVALFTAPFDTPYQQVLQQIAASPTHSITHAYAATVTVSTVASVPEPGTMVLFGLGLCGIGVLKFRKTA